MSLQTRIVSYMLILISTKYVCVPQCRGALGMNANDGSCHLHGPISSDEEISR